jgi:hypothetical protein
MRELVELRGIHESGVDALTRGLKDNFLMDGFSGVGDFVGHACPGVDGGSCQAADSEERSKEEAAATEESGSSVRMRAIHVDLLRNSCE